MTSENFVMRKNIRPEQCPNTRVCSDYFASVSPSALFDENNPDWVPSLNIILRAWSLLRLNVWKV